MLRFLLKVRFVLDQWKKKLPEAPNNKPKSLLYLIGKFVESLTGVTSANELCQELKRAFDVENLELRYQKHRLSNPSSTK